VKGDGKGVKGEEMSMVMCGVMGVGRVSEGERLQEMGEGRGDESGKSRMKGEGLRVVSVKR
jgi:hypothetical protein